MASGSINLSISSRAPDPKTSENMSVEKISKIEDVIRLEENQKITGQKINRLTSAGENFGSLMLSVDITVEDQDGRTSEIKTVAKLVPPNQFLQQVFNTQVTFRNEIGFYKHVIPNLQNFQKEHGMDKVISFFPKYFGSRLNLTGESSNNVDSDAVLLLENLKASNYSNVDKTIGFDLDVAEVIIKDLAHLHGVALALKLQKPQVFEKEVSKYLLGLRNKAEAIQHVKAKLQRMVESMDSCKAFTQRVLTAFEKPPNPLAREPFATLCHNDVWVNNIMVNQEDGTIKHKLVDFQICDYGSPAKDILFFLFSSVKNQVVEEHYEDFIKLYHETLTALLEKLECDSSLFSMEVLGQELNYEAKNSQFAHILFMLFPIFAPKGVIKDISEFSRADLLQGEPTDLHMQKLEFVIQEFVKRNWI